ncbi:glycine zipper 2TM domain-containing protein [Paraferrimonas haliotis]|uniref:Membrane protein n=1 Tax=Paraferrimonas haliotis TaxID=2013866 RepID=A0AA37TMW9_9GAMM|nr:membrane protein [Paraferrimonas haliotis]
MKTVNQMVVIALLMCFSLGAQAYQRNQAVPVQKVEYGSVESVRNVTKEEIVQDRNSGWKTFGGAVLGGVIGHQFGGGRGQDVATVLGVIAGGAIANNRNPNQYKVQQQIVELMIRQESGETVMVVQDYDAGMVFRAGDEVRVVYLSGYVRVDKAM